MINVSVIVPIYNVGKYIERCAESLLSQTMKSGIEFIFVDDAATDNSIDILKTVIARHPERKDQVKLLTHPVNKGLPAARNTGMDAAEGEYIYHCDSDDYIEADMLRKMYMATLTRGADIVWCDWYLTFPHNERYMSQPMRSTQFSAVRSMLDGTMKYNVWNKIVRKKLYTDNGIRFPEGHSMGEDMTMIRLMSRAVRGAYVHEAFYHYVKSDVAMSSGSLSDRALADLKFNTDETIGYLKSVFGKGLTEGIALFKLNVKLPFLLTGSIKDYRRWQEWYPEADKYIWNNTRLSFRIKLLQQFAAWGIYPAIWVYFNVFQRFMYGVIYK